MGPPRLRPIRLTSITVPHQGKAGSSKNFYMAVRNLRIDTTKMPSNIAASAIDWSVSQGCSLTNVHIRMPPSSGHIGITMNEGGSGTIISDCSFTGGAIGLRLANQQYMLKGLKFDGCNVGISVQGSMVSTVQGCSFTNCNYGVDMGAANSSGAMSIVDSSVSKCTAGVNAYVSGGGQGSLVLDNFAVSDAVAVRTSSGETLRQDTVPSNQVWVLGNTQVVSITEDPEHRGIYRTNTTIHVPPGSRLTGEVFSTISGAGSHFSDVSNPQPVVRVGRPGDRGVAQLTDLLITVASPLPGAVLLQINMAPNPSSPGSVGVWNCVLRVGGAADSLVNTQCAAPEPANCRAAHTLLHLAPSASAYLEDAWGWVADHSLDDPSTHTSAITKKSAAANPEQQQLWQPQPQTIAVGRGALVESGTAGPAWLVGTSFEHTVLYQYALRGARSVYLGQHQSETPYWQGKGAPLRAPAPWGGAETQKEGGEEEDAELFEGCIEQKEEEKEELCRRAWGLHVSGGVKDVVVHGSAMWSFYGGATDGSWSDPECALTGGICQTNMAYVEEAKGLWWFSATSKAAENLVVDGGNGGAGSKSSRDTVVTSMKEYPGGWGAVVAAYLRHTKGGGGDGGSDDGDGNGDDSGGAMAKVSGLGLLVMALTSLGALMLFG
ncbi:pectate lyase superfamily protein-domain-containing protein [Corynascus similis CBS 632.67]